MCALELGLAKECELQSNLEKGHHRCDHHHHDQSYFVKHLGRAVLLSSGLCFLLNSYYWLYSNMLFCRALLLSSGLCF